MNSLIEDYLPIEAISEEAAREKALWRAHISTLHLWWARRPLVAARAAVFGALCRSEAFQPESGANGRQASLGRANAAKFMTQLCSFPGHSAAINQARRQVFKSHALRLTEELKKPISGDDVEEGRAPRPKVLDIFSGGGAIPLEASRLGCDTYALDLNPVAHIIELCTLRYPQLYGSPDRDARGSDAGSWAGLAKEVEHWGTWIGAAARGCLEAWYVGKPESHVARETQNGAAAFWSRSASSEAQIRTPSAFIWTRTVRCKNPACSATVPLVRQTWLCKKQGRYVGLKSTARRNQKQVQFEIVEATAENQLGFDPGAGSTAGNATCPFCGTVADIDYVKDQGWNN